MILIDNAKTMILTLFFLSLNRKRYFEILINDDRSARLEWQPYNKYAEEPIGAVAGL